MSNDRGCLPTLHVVADSLPQAHFRAMKAVWENGLPMRTEYDRKENGMFIDPPSRDARVLVEIKDLFAEPRYPPVSFCEIGTYIAEIMGAKDHMVLSMKELKEAINNGGELSAHTWPYSYHSRIVSHPDLDGSLVNQLELAIDRVAKTPHTRRAVITTSVPNLDPYLKEDVPCLREIQLRCAEVDNDMILNVSTTWRSRDLFKAWPDNLIGLSFLFQIIAQQIQKKMGRPVKLGSYADYAMSLHIYGQDFKQVGGDAEKGLKSFFDTFDEESYMKRALNSEDAKEMLVLPQLRELLTPEKVKEWKFPQRSTDLLRHLVDNIENGTYKV